MLTSVVMEKYRINRSTLNALLWESKLTPIYNHSYDYIDKDGRVFYMENQKFIEKKPVKFTKKHNMPIYRIINDITGEPEQIRLDEIYLSTFYMPLNIKESTKYSKDWKFEYGKLDEIKYCVKDYQRIDENTLIINGSPFKRIFLNGKESTNYFISEMGVVFENNYQRFRKMVYNMKFYVYVTIMEKLLYIHRLVYNTWNDKTPWIDSSIQIDHIDGFKTHNWVSNLREATALENYRNAAYEQGLRSTIWTPEIIKTVCKMMAKGTYGPKDISDAIGIPYDKTKKKIYEILDKGHWSDISKKYDIENYRRMMHTHTHMPTQDEIIHKICQEYITGKYKTNKDLANKLGLSETIVNTVLRSENRPDISSQYDLNYSYKKRKDEEEVHEMCKKIMSGIPTKKNCGRV